MFGRSCVVIMSSNHLNLYVTKNAKGLSSLETLCATMFGAKRGKFNQKQQLQYLREMSIYLSAVATIDESVFAAIIAYLKELGESDVDRKLFRTSMFLLVECIADYGARAELTNKSRVVDTLVTLLEKELKQKTWSTRQVLVWRTLGSIVHLHHLAPRPQQQGSSGADVKSAITSRLVSTFEELQYPVKQKKSVLFGDDKDFLPKLLSWAAVTSGVVRSGEALPRKAWDNLLCGLNCAIYKPLAQHAHRLLHITAKQQREPKAQLEFINLLLSDRGDGASSNSKNSKNSKDASTNMSVVDDPVCGTFYIRSLVALARNCHELRALQVCAGPQLSAQSEVVRALVGLFVSALRYLDSE